MYSNGSFIEILSQFSEKNSKLPYVEPKEENLQKIVTFTSFNIRN